MNALSVSSITDMEAVSEARATFKDFLRPNPPASSGLILSEYPKRKARTMEIEMLAKAAQSSREEITMPIISPMAQPVRQCNVALAAVLFNPVIALS
jgi:hypothetical protein